eukprot:CAMPEP_0118947636 /NCGR_PEP_ID=MMETSP1169-20130426/46391_1 /TAXON_ID=36882 /ORGANISM="Pyramimonas obovata, Strain CCMP722" /LENGTH=75 /DNA_ID=CAMNT_0006893889 /DNA_START=39 /DNA_END=262 /DNA_ORIENTATION=+
MAQLSSWRHTTVGRSRLISRATTSERRAQARAPLVTVRMAGLFSPLLRRLKVIARTSASRCASATWRRRRQAAAA